MQLRARAEDKVGPGSAREVTRATTGCRWTRQKMAPVRKGLRRRVRRYSQAHAPGELQTVVLPGARAWLRRC